MERVAFDVSALREAASGVGLSSVAEDDVNDMTDPVRIRRIKRQRNMVQAEAELRDRLVFTQSDPANYIPKKLQVG